MVNDVLVGLSHKYEISLWSMDWVWFSIVNQNELTLNKVQEENFQNEPAIDINQNLTENTPQNSRFYLERHLEDFLVENWDNTVLAKDFGLEILTNEETGEVEGEQYRTETGRRIDILCRNKKTGGFTVIELKRNRTSDEVVGQIQSYMGWVIKRLANGKPVDGIVVCHDADEDLRFALVTASNVRCLLYQVSFDLKPDNTTV